MAKYFIIKKLKNRWGRGKSKQYLCVGIINAYAWYPTSQARISCGNVKLAEFTNKKEALRAATNSVTNPRNCEFIVESV